MVNSTVLSSEVFNLVRVRDEVSKGVKLATIGNTIWKVQEQDLKGFKVIFDFGWRAKLNSHFVTAGGVKLVVIGD
jgi:hypothetical protein